MLSVNHRHLRKAFTLIELLVVISIISLLVSMMLPALRAARESANNMKCMNNLRTIGTFTEVYLSDNRQVYFMTHGNTLQNTYRALVADWATMRWTTGLAVKYGLPGPNYMCPTRVGIEHRTAAEARDFWSGDMRRHNYPVGINSLTPSDMPAWSRPSYGMNTEMPFKRQADVLRPSQLLLFSESRNAGMELNSASYGCSWVGSVSGNYSLLSVHSGESTVNILWGDGHVAPKKALASGSAGYATYYQSSVLGNKNTSAKVISGNGYWNPWVPNGNN